jgi:histidine triad (HIT) family protein
MASDRERCAFCEIVAGRIPATIVASDAHVVAFLDLRQFHPGHVLIIPRDHVPDIRASDDAVIIAVARMVARVARAVDRCFPGDGLSVWHSAGPGANQEVPHLHFHVHPRRIGDELLRIYPQSPVPPDRATLDAWGAELVAALADSSDVRQQR